METEQSIVGQGAAVCSLPAAGAASTLTAAGRLGKRGRGRRRLLRAFVSEASAREAKGGARRDRCVCECGRCVRGVCGHDGELHEGRRGVLHDYPSGLGATHLVMKRNGLQAGYVGRHAQLDLGRDAVTLSRASEATSGVRLSGSAGGLDRPGGNV